MIRGGITTLYVSDMDRAIEFYTRTLGLRVTRRHGNSWAEVSAGAGLTLGLHPVDKGGGAGGDEGAPRAGIPSSPSAIKIGLQLDRPLSEVVEVLTARGVVVEGPVEDDSPVRLAFFTGPDGNPFYLFEYVEAVQER